MTTTLARLVEALKEIRDGRKPQVCAEYEICIHEGCRASYAAFAIADAALAALRRGQSFATASFDPKNTLMGVVGGRGLEGATITWPEAELEPRCDVCGCSSASG